MSDSRKFAFSDASSSTLYSALSPAPTISEKRFRDTNDTIPTPGDTFVHKRRPKAYEPLYANLAVVIVTSLFFILLGVGLFIATAISRKRQGFPVKALPIQIFGTLSAQFIASIVPVLIIVPMAVLFREQDWTVRSFQPYVRLNQGNALAEESLLLDYVSAGPFASFFPALHYKHWVIAFSVFAAGTSYIFQPLASAICQIRQTPQTDFQDVISTEKIGLADGIENLNGFLAAAGYVQAAAIRQWGDPPFVFKNWTTAEFVFPTNQMLNETLSINTTAISTQPHCANPTEDVVPVPVPGTTTFTFSSISIGRCTPSTNVTFNASLANQQYGVVDVNCPDAPQDNIEKRPVMFWFLNINEDEVPPKQEIKTVFCAPSIIPFTVQATAHLQDGKLDSCAKSGDFDHDNDVTGPPNNGEAFNALFFNASDNPIIQAKAAAIALGVPNAIFQRALLEPGGIEDVFSHPNKMLDLTTELYTQHLSISAKAIYFTKSESTVPGLITSIAPRLWFDPLPSTILSCSLIICGVVGLIVQIISYRQRRQLLLTTPPGTIASVTALTARSGFGELLLPYDNTEEMEKKLEGIRFRLDKRTGAIVADEVGEGIPGVDSGRNEALRALLGQQNERFGHHVSSSQLALQSASGYPPWVAKAKLESVY